jgi:hypothetical protein
MALREDNINATLNINDSPARAEMTKLSEDTGRLRQQNRRTVQRTTSASGN